MLMLQRLFLLNLFYSGKDRARLSFDNLELREPLVEPIQTLEGDLEKRRGEEGRKV